MGSKIRVAVVDDHPLFREGVVHTLRSEPEFEVVAQGGSAAEALQICQEQEPDILLMDLSMPGSGLTALQCIREAALPVKVLMLTVAADAESVGTALQSAARGYVLKGVGGVELVRAVRSVAQGDQYVSPSLAAQLLSQGARALAGEVGHNNGFDLLSNREEQVLTFVSEGLSNKEIGRRLDLSEKTVKHHVTSLFQKLQVRNRVEAALYAAKLKAASGLASCAKAEPSSTGISLQLVTDQSRAGQQP
jgi:two-component system nitrate/nitrite response regulator NarL